MKKERMAYENEKDGITGVFYVSGNVLYGECRNLEERYSGKHRALMV